MTDEHVNGLRRLRERDIAANDLLEDGVRFREMLALLPELCGVHIHQLRPNDWRITDTSPARVGLDVGGSHPTFVDAFRAAMRHVMGRDDD